MVRIMPPNYTLPMVIVAAAVAVGTACEKKRPTQSATGNEIINVRQADPRLVAATEEARRRFPEFLDTYKRNEGNGRFMVKVGLAVKGGGTEHLWIDVTDATTSSITGTLNDEPYYDVGHKMGDQITTSPRELEDWAYNLGQGLVGNFSEPVLRQLDRERSGK